MTILCIKKNNMTILNPFMLANIENRLNFSEQCNHPKPKYVLHTYGVFGFIENL